MAARKSSKTKNTKAIKAPKLMEPDVKSKECEEITTGATKLASEAERYLLSLDPKSKDFDKVLRAMWCDGTGVGAMINNFCNKVRNHQVNHGCYELFNIDAKSLLYGMQDVSSIDIVVSLLAHNVPKLSHYDEDKSAVCSRISLIISDKYSIGIAPQNLKDKLSVCWNYIINCAQPVTIVDAMKCWNRTLNDYDEQLLNNRSYNPNPSFLGSWLKNSKELNLSSNNIRRLINKCLAVENGIDYIIESGLDLEPYKDQIATYVYNCIDPKAISFAYSKGIIPEAKARKLAKKIVKKQMSEYQYSDKQMVQDILDGKSPVKHCIHPLMYSFIRNRGPW